MILWIVPSFSEPLVESVGVTGKLLAEAVVVFLTLGFLQQLGIAFRNDLLQVAPSILKGFHGEPGVRVWSNFEALDLTIQGGKRFEIHLSR